MTTDAQPRKGKARDRGRVPYRFTGEQVLKMVEAGIIVEDVELWAGVIYKMTKGELHNYLVSETADRLRPLTPRGYHVREEKSSTDGKFSLPEPDVAVARGNKGDYLPDPPPLARMALLVEVTHHTRRADEGPKLRRYAEVGVPFYWIVEAKRREVRAFTRPDGSDEDARYAEETTYKMGQDIPVIIDGHEVGRIAVADLFPPEESP